MERIPQEHEARLRANLESVRRRITGALAAAGRPPDAARLVAVTKTVSPAVIHALVQLGQTDLGENRPEEVPLKAIRLAGLGSGVRWHMIGHYQNRKIRDTLSFFHLVHSVHGPDLLDRLEKRSADLGRSVPVLLQVNVAAEAAKQGFAPDDVGPALEAWVRWPHLDVCGLMTMAPLGLEPRRLRGLFGALRELRDRLARPDRPLPELSMGMSQDFEEAILEGATLVRVGSALFEGLPADLR